MVHFLFILISLLVSFSVSASYKPESRFLLDYKYQCQTSVKDYDSDEYVLQPNSDFILQVGKKREKMFFNFEIGGPWFSLQDVNSGDLMVFGITDCTPTNNYIAVNSYCTDRINYDNEGYGYYWKGNDWKRVTAPSSLPGLYNTNLVFDQDLWEGVAEAGFSTTTFTDIDTDMKSRVTVWSCRR